MGIPRLCYIEEPWAYFTTRKDWQNQWGDDWEDFPYEHNAGRPYKWLPPSAVPRYEVVKVAFEGDFKEPLDGHLNSPWSVEMINQRQVPWLAPDWIEHDVSIYAGETLEQFIHKVRLVGGTVYLAERALEAEAKP